MSITLKRYALLETVLVENPTGVDAQGMPQYAAPVAVQARVVQQSVAVRQANGEEVQTSVSMWIDGEQPVLPVTDARITLATSWAGIVVERMDGLTIAKVLDHVRVRLREE